MKKTKDSKIKSKDIKKNNLKLLFKITKSA